MSKKRKRSRPQDRGKMRRLRQQLDEAEQWILRQKYDRVLDICERILDEAPPGPIRADALEYLAHALIMTKRFDESYAALSELVKLRPKSAYVWYNKSMAAVFSGRSGQALRDIRRAQSLEGKGEMAEEYAERRAFLEKVVQEELASRGPDFTLDQLIEQQEMFRRGMRLFQAGQWQEAEAIFRQVIAMSDCLPAPQNNLGVCLLMQGRFDEAEAAFRRALELDPDYQIARKHLKQLDKARKSGEIPRVEIHDPYRDVKIENRFI